MCNVPQRPDDLADPVAFIDELVVAIVSSWMYSATHPRVSGSVKKLVKILSSIGRESKEKSLRIGAADGYLFHNKKPLLSATLSAPRILQVIEDVDGGGLEFDIGMTTEDCLNFLEANRNLRGLTMNYQQANKEITSLNCQSIRYLPPFGIGAGEGGDDVEVPSEQTRRSGTYSAYRAPVQVYKGIINHLQSVTVSICRGSRLDISAMSSHIESIMRRLETDPLEMQNLSRYEHLDAFTFGHSVRVCFLALTFARSLTDDENLIRRVGLASLLHDVGKAHIPFEILHSKGKLSPAERQEMEKHTTLGALTLLELADPDPLVVAAAFGHHRSKGANSYPKLDDWIPVSRITELIKVCDVYEALTAARPYKPPMHPIKAYRIMFSMGEHFDRALLRQFIQKNGIYPVGTLIELNDGAFARVESQTANLESPIVCLQTTPEGEDLHEEDQSILNLSLQEGLELAQVQGGPHQDAKALPA